MKGLFPTCTVFELPHCCICLLLHGLDLAYYALMNDDNRNASGLDPRPTWSSAMTQFQMLFTEFKTAPLLTHPISTFPNKRNQPIHVALFTSRSSTGDHTRDLPWGPILMRFGLNTAK
jgi:hypothetical protein